MDTNSTIAAATAAVGIAAIAYGQWKPGDKSKVIASVGYSLLLVAAVTYGVKVLKL